MEIYENINAEQAILGTIIMNNIYYQSVSDILLPAHFALEGHQKLYCYISNIIADKAELVNSITLQQFFCQSLPELGIDYLGILLYSATGVVDIREYAKIVIELWQKRQLAAIINQINQKLGEITFAAAAAEIENEIAGLTYHETKNKTQSSEEIIDELEYVNRNSEFIATEFAQLDQLLDGGMYKKQLYIVGARPGIGKTSFGQNIILNVAKKNKSCLFVSLEVDKRNAMLKFISQLSMVDNWKLRRNLVLTGLENEDVIAAKKNLKKMKIYINDSSQLSIAHINNIIKNYLVRNSIDLVVVDYIQIIRGQDIKGKNEATIIKEITTSLKAIAKQYNVAVLALAQINRKAVEGAKQEPTINDFKSSGGIEEDADVCLIIHRDRNDDKKENYFAEIGKIIVAKNRHGRTGEISIKFEGDYGIFREYEALL